MSALLLAAALSLPIPGRIKGIPESIAKGSGAAFVEVVVDPTGKAVSCIRVSSFGDAWVVKQLCKIDAAGGYQPAKGKDGKATWGVLRTFLALSAGPIDTSRLSRPVQYEVAVAELPKGAKKAVEVEIVVEVGEGGKVTACEASQKTKKELLPLVERACAEATSRPVEAPRAGQLPNYVTNITVRFNRKVVVF